MDGYAHVMELQVGDTVIVDAGWAAREAERTAPKGPNNHAKGGIWAGMIGAGNPGFLDGRHVYPYVRAARGCQALGRSL
jgi:hypothetical protein